MRGTPGSNTWKKKRNDIEIMINHVQNLSDVNDTESSSYKVLQRLRQERSKMDVEAMRVHVHTCPGVNGTSLAMDTALRGIEEAEEIIHSQDQLNGSMELSGPGSLSSIRASPIAPPLAFSPESPPLSLKLEENNDEEEKKEGGHNFTINRITLPRPEGNAFNPQQIPGVVKKEEENIDFVAFEGNTNNSSNKSSSTLGFVLRLILLHIPLASIFIFASLTFCTRHVYYKYWEPITEALVWYDGNKQPNEYTFYRRECHKSDITSLNVDDFIVDPNTTTSDEAVDIINKHGVAIFPNIVTEEAAAEMREFVLRKNDALKEDEKIWLISNKNRWSFSIGGDDDPSVPPVFHQIATNFLLQSSLDLLLGDDPAMVEFTVITSAYGAADQHWHADTGVEEGGMHYARSFVPMYTLFIPLQDTTPAMGATSACPGTHMCGEEEYLTDVCTEADFQVYDTRGRLAEREEDHTWKTGDGFLMHLNLFHRGPAHTDPNAPERVMILMSVAPRPNGPHFDKRALSLGTSYSQRWDMWGLTMKDMVDIEKAMALPWKMLRFFGLYKPDNQWGFDYFTVVASRILNDQFGFRADDLKEFTELMSKKNLAFDYFFGQMPVNTKTEDKWQEYFQETLEKLVIFSAVLSFSSCILYICIGACIGSFRKSVSNVFKMSTMVGILSFAALHQVSVSPWGQDVISGRIHDQPFEKIDRETSITHEDFLEGKTTLPMASDIFVGLRLNSDFLAGANSQLEYQPGNLRLSAYTDNLYGVYPNDHISSIAAENIVNKLKEENHRVIWQNLNSDWKVGTQQRATNFVKIRLMTKSSPLMMTIKEELSTLLSECRHGRMRKTAMFKKHVQMQLLNLEEALFESETPKGLTQKTSVSLLSLDKLEPPRARRKQVETPKEKYSFVVGDFVEAKFDEGWYRGRIIDINGRRCRVLYDDDITVTEFLETLRPYVGVTQGERVRSLAHDEDADVVRATADGFVTLRGLDGTLRRNVRNTRIIRLK